MLEVLRAAAANDTNVGHFCVISGGPIAARCRRWNWMLSQSATTTFAGPKKLRLCTTKGPEHFYNKWHKLGSV